MGSMGKKRMPFMLAVTWLIAIAVILIACGDLLSLSSMDIPHLLLPSGLNASHASEGPQHHPNLSFLGHIDRPMIHGPSHVLDKNSSALTKAIENAYLHFV